MQFHNEYIPKYDLYKNGFTFGVHWTVTLSDKLEITLFINFYEWKCCINSQMSNTIAENEVCSQFG